MDLSTKAKSRIIWQYKNSPKFISWVDVLPSIGQKEIEDEAEKIINVLDIDSQEGHLLELVGRIVGQPKNDPLLNDDAVYRIVIKSKVWKNNSDALIDSIAEAAEIITGSAVRSLTDNQDMSFSIIFREHLSGLARDLIDVFDLIPRPQGVKLSGLIDPPPEEPFFGFSEVGMATPSYIAGFAELSDPGGYFVEFIGVG